MGSAENKFGTKGPMGWRLKLRGLRPACPEGLGLPKSSVLDQEPWELFPGHHQGKGPQLGSVALECLPNGEHKGHRYLSLVQISSGRHSPTLSILFSEK